MEKIRIDLAGVTVPLALRLPGTKEHFRGFLTDAPCEGEPLCVGEREAADYPLICPDGALTPGAEAYLLMAHVSRALLPRERVLLHGAAFLWRGRAWLLTAPSGEGKTTQLRHWQRLWGGELRVINGDKTVLRRDGAGAFWLHPSPWTGKEGDAGSDAGELAGIVLLRQAEENRMVRLRPGEAVLPMWDQLLMTGETEEEVRAAGSLLNGLLRRVPVWRLENRGDEDSARLTRAILEEEA